MDERFLINLQAAILEAKQWAVLKMHCALVEVNVIHHCGMQKITYKKITFENTFWRRESRLFEMHLIFVPLELC